MLALVVKLDVPDGVGIVGFAVVFQMIRAQPHLPVVQVHVSVGDEEIALAFLCFRRKIGISRLSGRQPRLLRRISPDRSEWEEENQKSEQPELEEVQIKERKAHARVRSRKAE